MTDQSLQFPRFYVTAPSPCPYLEGREERKVFTELKGGDAQALNDALSRVGFRRSQSVAYRPACEGCAECISVRVPVERFQPSRTMRRIARKNCGLTVHKMPPVARVEYFSLLRKYLQLRHPDGGMTEMDFEEFAEMVENSTVDTHLYEYRLPPDHETDANALVAVALSDRMGDGFSMVYSFFNPYLGQPSLGTFMIIDHIRRAQAQGLAYVYLGYWIHGSSKMGYKAQFQPLERLGPEGWYPFSP